MVPNITYNTIFCVVRKSIFLDTGDKTVEYLCAYLSCISAHEECRRLNDLTTSDEVVHYVETLPLLSKIGAQL